MKNPNEARGVILPRWAVPLVWSVPILLIHFLIPWAVSRLGAGWGWAGGAPGALNLSGLLVLAAGLAIYVGCLAAHFRSYPARVRLSPSTPALVLGGPYRFSRNPMYLAAVIAWVGWAVFYGSFAVLVAAVLLGAAFNWQVIPAEERHLEAQYGEVYRSYLHSTRRWIGRG